MSAPLRLADQPGAVVCDRDRTVALNGFAGRAAPQAAALKGRCALIRAGNQIDAAAAMVQLDGLVRRLVVAPPDLYDDKLAAVLQDAEVDAVVGGGTAPAGVPSMRLADDGDLIHVRCDADTEWVMLTSGTAGRPKLVGHTLSALCGAIAPIPQDGAGDTVWATFYDIRRYGGLQILLRAMLGGTRLLVGSPGEDVAAQTRRFGAGGATAITGTPSHWRSALIGSAHDAIAPRYIRLSGETADQMTLDALQAAYPGAHVAHAYASTEAGVVFTVDDGRAGFPAAYVDGDALAPVSLRVVDDALRVRSPHAANGYLGPHAPALFDPDGFVETGDRVERRGDRYCFAGRRNGIINVGGLKVSPEEVEAVLNACPGVSRSLVKAKTNPLIGAIVAADVMLRDGVVGSPDLQNALLQQCRERLERHKVPALLRFVSDLPLTKAGKLSRAP